MPKKLSDTATSACWDFLNNEDIVNAIEYAAQRAAKTYDGALYEDQYQEACLWLAVRPQKVQDYAGREDLLGAHLYGKLSRQLDIESRLVPDGREANAPGW